MWYNRYKHIKALSVLERSIEKCQRKDVTAKIEFCGRERAREKTEDMLTNI